MGRPGTHVPLIGRAPELEILEGELKQAANGRLRFILIDGAAGVGKSRLMNEAIDRHRKHALVLSARSYRLGATTSFGPWIEAIDRHALSTGDARTRERIGVTGNTEPDRDHLLEEVTSILARLSDEDLVLVGLDDIHLADASSWEALRFISRRLWNRSIAVLATARTAGLLAQPILGDVVHGLGDDQALRRINVRPLNFDEVADLVQICFRDRRDPEASLVPRSLVQWLVDRSLGHPLFALSLIDALLEDGVDVAAPDLIEVPTTLRSRVGLELHALEPDARQVLEMLAVMDQRTDPQDVADALSWDFTAVGSVLERLCASGLAREGSAGPGFIYEIAHPLIQDAIYELIGGARRMGLHRLVARVHLARGRLGPAAAHFSRSALVADDESLEALCQAMNQAERKGLYRQALAILSGLPDIIERGDPRWLRVLETITWQADWVVDHLAEGDAEGAIIAMRRIEEVCRDRSDLVAQGTVQFHLASFLSIGAGRLDEAATACSRAIELFEAAGERDRSLLSRNEMVWISSCAGDLERSSVLAAELLDSADHTTDHQIINQAAGARAYALSLAGRFTQSIEHYELADRVWGDEETGYRRIWGLVQRSLALTLSGRLTEAVEAIEEALEADYSKACDALALERLAHCRWLQGNLAESVRLVDESTSRRAVRGSRRRAWGLAVAARALGEMGQAARAKRYLAQAAETYRGDEIMDWSAWCHWTSGFLSVLGDDPGQARLNLERALDRYRAMGARAVEGLVLVDLAESGLLAGDLDVVERATMRLDEIADRVDGRLHSTLADIHGAIYLLARSEEESELPIAPIRRLADHGYQLLATGATHMVGLTLLERGDDRAAEFLAEAARMADECGSVWRRDRALAALKKMGTAGRKLVGSILGPESLTRREREVAELAARGHTAAQIGERLFIGTRTVESHLANIYPKLGVTSKQDLVANAADLALVETSP